VSGLLQDIEFADGTPYLGALCDALLGMENKSLEVNVHRIAFSDLIDSMAGCDPEVVGRWGMVRIDVGDVDVWFASWHAGLRGPSRARRHKT
jgi:hypothetical protein